jgi:hypothetical protein
MAVNATATGPNNVSGLIQVQSVTTAGGIASCVVVAGYEGNFPSSYSASSVSTLGTLHNHNPSSVAGLGNTGATLASAGGIKITTPGATLGSGAVTPTSSASTAYFTGFGSPGLNAGDVLTVINVNALTNGSTATHGTVLVTSVDDPSGILGATVLSPGGGYTPGAACIAVGNTGLARIATGSPQYVPQDFVTPPATLGSNSRDGVNTDLKRY